MIRPPPGSTRSPRRWSCWWHSPSSSSTSWSIWPTPGSTRGSGSGNGHRPARGSRRRDSGNHWPPSVDRRGGRVLPQAPAGRDRRRRRDSQHRGRHRGQRDRALRPGGDRLRRDARAPVDRPLARHRRVRARRAVAHHLPLAPRDAARAAGFRHRRIIVRYMLPNVMAPYLIMLTAFLGQAILLEASLSFLGLGVSEPTPAWGLMLRGAAVQFAESAPWMAIFPGLAISLAVFAFNLFGDSLRDALDPRLRTQ